MKLAQSSCLKPKSPVALTFLLHFVVLTVSCCIFLFTYAQPKTTYNESVFAGATLYGSFVFAEFLKSQRVSSFTKRIIVLMLVSGGLLYAANAIISYFAVVDVCCDCP